VSEIELQQHAAAPRPIREGLMQMEPPRLIGTRCSECGTVTFPAREFCPACDSEILPARIPLSESGIIYSYTVVYQAPPGRKTPYVLAYVDLESGVRVLAQIDTDPQQLAIGSAVTLDIRAVGHENGHPLIGYVFVPKRNAKEAI